MYDLFVYGYHRNVPLGSQGIAEQNDSIIHFSMKNLPKVSKSEGQLLLIPRIGNPPTCRSLPQIQLVNGGFQMRHWHQHIHHIRQFLAKKTTLDPWKWYIYPHLVHKNQTNVGKYASCMDPICE